MTGESRQIGPYVVERELGRGATGVVHLARDERLDRRVAIKTLSVAVGDDPTHLARLRREARVLAQLDHPGIARIFDVQQDGDTWFLVLEYAPGGSLRDRLQRGAVRADEALTIARQVAAALAAAHEVGVVHRDLKPDNLALGADGTVKVLDFGLARPGTVSAELSVEGQVVGTPAYMSPEQLRGRGVDRRADVWAFGCVLFEMLAGGRPFAAETVADLVPLVLDAEPDWSALPANTPGRVRVLLQRCLAKDADRRLRDLGDAALELDDAIAGREWRWGAPRGDGRARVLRNVALIAAGLALGAAVTMLARGGAGAADRAPDAAPRRLSVAVPDDTGLLVPRIARDGTAVFYLAERPGSPRVIVRRALDAFDATPIAGTENAVTHALSPAGGYLVALVESASADGTYEVVRADITGAETPKSLGRWPQNAQLDSAIAWLDNDVVVGIATPSRLVRFPLDGSEPTQVAIESLPGQSAQALQIYRGLPGGRHVLVNSWFYEEGTYRPAVLGLEVETGRVRRIAEDAMHAAYAGGRLLYTRRDVLFAQPFDPDELAFRGEPTELESGLRTGTSYDYGWFDVSADGAAVVFRPGGVVGADRSIGVIGDDGETTRFVADTMAFEPPLLLGALGRVVTIGAADAGGILQLYAADVDNPLLRRILAEPGVDCFAGIVSPDGGHLVYSRLGGGNRGLFLRALSDGSERRLDVGDECYPFGFSERGQRLFARRVVAGRMEAGCIRLDDGDAPFEPLFELPGEYCHPRVSPAGDWLTYMTSPTGARRVGLRALRHDGSVGPELSLPGALTGAADFVKWSSIREEDRQYLLVLGRDKRLTRIAVSGTDSPRFGNPEFVADVGPRLLNDYLQLPDGRVIALLQGESEREPGRFDLLLLR